MFSKWALYTIVWPRPKGTSDVSVLAALAAVVLLVGNIIRSVLAVRAHTELSLRLARLCGINLVLLFLSGRVSMILDKVFRLSIIEYYFLHC